MASSIKAVIATQFDDTGLKKAQKAFGSVGSGLRTAIGAAGLAIGIGAITSGLISAGKAAAEDAQSQALLATQLQNTVGANDALIASVEGSIKAMQLAAAVADDEIRPAFAQLVRATGDVGKATSLTQLALDVSAGTGRSLSSVTMALSKAYGGNTGALTKLGIKAKDGVGIFAQLSTEFEGAAKAAAENDPFKRLQVVVGELQEQIGVGLIPIINNVAEYLTTADFTTSFANLGVAVNAAITEIDKLFQQVVGKNAFTTIVDLASAAAVGIAEIAFWLGDVGTTIGYIFNGKWDKAGNQMATYFTRYNKFVNGIYKKQDEAAAQAVEIVKRPKFEPEYYEQEFDGIKKTTAAEVKKTEALKASKAAQEANSKARIKYWEDLVKTRELLQAQAEAEQELQNQLIETRKELQAATVGMTDLFKAQVDVGEFESRVVDSFSNVKDVIKSALADGKITGDAASSLNLLATSTEASLRAMGKQLDQLTAKRKAAQDLFDDVKGSILGSGQLTGLMETQSRQVTKTVTSIVNGLQVAVSSTTEEITSGGLISNFKKVLDKTKAFAEQLKTLRKLGLDQNLFKQIVDAGADAGGAIASEIIAGGADSIIEINQVYKDLAEVSGNIAEQTAVVFFNDGKDVVGGLVNGLLAQEQQLVDAATILANAFLTTFEQMIAKLEVPRAAETVSIPSEFQSYFNGATAGLSGATLLAQEKMLTGVDVSAPGSFMNSIGYMSGQGQRLSGNTVNVVVNAGVGTNGKAVGQAIQTELNKFAKSNA